MSWANYAHLGATPDDRSVEEEVKFSDTETDFVGWVSPTYIDTLGKFNEANAYAADIIRIDYERPKPRLWGGDDLGEEGARANVRLAAYAARGRSLTGRIRVFGDDVAVGGYACALPLEQVTHRMKCKRKILQVDPTYSFQGHTFEFSSPVNVFVFTAISCFIPLGNFNDENAVAIDIKEVDGAPTDTVWYGGDHLGADGEPTNLRMGVFAGEEVSSVAVRLRTFGSDVAAAGYAICLFYEL